MLTSWGERLDKNNILPEYPRPQMRRDSYYNLNGEWDYAITAAGEKQRKSGTARYLCPSPPSASCRALGVF